MLNYCVPPSVMSVSRPVGICVFSCYVEVDCWLAGRFRREDLRGEDLKMIPSHTGAVLPSAG